MKILSLMAMELQNNWIVIMFGKELSKMDKEMVLVRYLQLTLSCTCSGVEKQIVF